MVLAAEASFLRTWKSTALSEDFFSLNVGSSAKTVQRKSEINEQKPTTICAVFIQQDHMKNSANSSLQNFITRNLENNQYSYAETILPIHRFSV